MAAPVPGSALCLSVEDLSALQVLLSLARYDAEDTELVEELRELLPGVLFIALPPASPAGGAS